MIKNLLILFTTISLTSQCSPPLNYIPHTLEEQIDYAGIILIGTITNIPNTNTFKKKASLINVVYYRGCGEKEIEVQNFHNQSTCGPGLPSVGGKIIVFACGDGLGGVLTLNEFMIHTGYVDWSFDKEQVVREITGVNSPGSCRCARRAEACMAREDNLCFGKTSTVSVPVRPFPVLRPIKPFNFNLDMISPMRNFNLSKFGNNK